MKLTCKVIALSLFSLCFVATSHARFVLDESGPVDCAQQFADHIEDIEDAYRIAYDRCSVFRVPAVRGLCWTAVSQVLHEMLEEAIEELRRCNGLPSEPRPVDP